MRSKLTKIALAAGFVLALAFTFSCSSPGGGGFAASYDYCITESGCLPGPFTASTCSGQLANTCPNNGSSPSSSTGGSSSSAGGSSSSVGNEPSYAYCIVALGCLPGPFTASTCTGQLANSCPVTPSSSSGNSSVGVPAAPTIRATASSNTIQVTWNAVAGAVGYVLYVSADGFNTYEYGLVEGTSYTEPDVPPGTYYFIVTAYNSNLDESGLSNLAFVTIAGSNPQPPGPGGTTFTSIADMKAWLASQPDNTPTTPYTVKLNVSTLGGSATAAASVGKALRDNPTKYVILDLSGSTFATIETNAFGSGTASNISLTLVGIIIPNTVTIIGNSAFQGTNITSINIPNSVTSIGNNAFQNCNSLTSITIPNSVTSIGGSAFSGCKGLISVTFAANSKVTIIGDSAFNGCTSLTSIIIPNSVTAIGRNAFNGCTSLTSATIGSGVTTIDYQAFYNCQSLVTVKFEGDAVVTFGSFSFSNTTNSTSTTNMQNAYDAGGAGTYTRSGNNWTKQ